MKRNCILPILLLATTGGFPVAKAQEMVKARQPMIAIIIDDLGNSLEEGRQVVALPGQVACSILPHTPFARELALDAHQAGKDVLLHLPLESVDNQPLGPGGITLDMTEKELQQTALADIEAIPYIQGVNNHMGSLMTQNPGDMAWLMQVLSDHGNLFFVDSYTSVHSVALQMAEMAHLPAVRRDVFLDDIQTPAAVRAQFDRLLGIAREKGYALAIGHPHPVTLAVLNELLPALESSGIRLVSVSTLVNARQTQTATLHASSSPPTQKAVEKTKYQQSAATRSSGSEPTL